MNPPAAGLPRDPDLKRVLVVDDEEIVMLALRETLQREGYEVMGIGSPTAAVEVLRTTAFSVIISDHRMPEMTGLEFLNHARQLQPEAARVLITAVLSLETVIGALNRGDIYRFLIKPWLREEFLVAIKDAQEHHALIIRNRQLQAATTAANSELRRVNEALARQLLDGEAQRRHLADLNRSIVNGLEESLHLGVRVLEAFSPALAGRMVRVNEVCTAVAESLALDAADRQVLEIAAWLHDLGMVAVPRSVIRRWESSNADLDEGDRLLIEQHPIVGQQLVGTEAPFVSAGWVIRAHHERFDGTGYPDGLVGDAIPWLARLLAVVSAWACSRQSPEMTLHMLQSSSGTAFDPEAVRAVLRMVPGRWVSPREREVLVSELAPGMVLARGVHTSSGVLLVPEGHTLNAETIAMIRSTPATDPVTQLIATFRR
jgi:response regulator RpfG family c-di-GMP phosphodiesterase